MWNLHQALNKNFSSSHDYLNLYRAHDILIADIQKMALDSATIVQVESSSIILLHTTGSKSWFVENKKLILFTQDLSKKHSLKTVVAENIESISFFADTLYDGRPRGIKCHFVSGGKTITRYCVL